MGGATPRCDACLCNDVQTFTGCLLCHPTVWRVVEEHQRNELALAQPVHRVKRGRGVQRAQV